MRKLRKTVVAVVLCLALLGGCYLQQGGWMMLSPRYDQSRLVGLTRDEVLQRLGPPDFDPKSAAAYTTRPWNETEDGPYYLGYFQGWATCSITFKEGKVNSVKRSWK